jgi:ferredoxin
VRRSLAALCGRRYYSAVWNAECASPVQALCGSRISNPEGSMPYIITETCIGVKDKACVDVCPVDCIYEGEQQLFIHPDECIDCGACEPECPVTAIFPEEDVPANQKQYIQINRDVFKGDNPPKKPTR